MSESFSNVIRNATQRREPFYGIAKKYIKEDAVILDIGAGNGSFAEFIGRDDIFMVDGNLDTVVQNQTRYRNYLHCILPDIPFRVDQFDVIHCSHVIEHLSSDDLYTLLINCNNRLKSGGYLIFSTPLMWEQFWDDLSHTRPYSPKIFEKYLCDTTISNPTRESISAKYTVVELQYRYNLRNIGPDVVIVRSRIINSLLQVILRFLTRVGFRRVEKTGYTIVLKKGLN